jgi:predicted nuclease of predicted toxin-antitoxin system
MKLLFDVHCAGTYLGSKAEIDKDHSVVCVGQVNELPQDMQDEKIIDYALHNDYAIITKDIDMVKRCLDRRAHVAVLKGNHIFFIESAARIIGREPPKELFSQN